MHVAEICIVLVLSDINFRSCNAHEHCDIQGAVINVSVYFVKYVHEIIVLDQ